MTNEHVQEADRAFKATVHHLTEELKSVRSNRPSLELVEYLKVNYYDQPTPIQQLGSLSIVPPRSIHIQIWDANAAGPIMKAIQDAGLGLSVSNEGNVIRATLAQLTNERRAELSKLVKKEGESTRIAIRGHRDEAMKKLRAAEESGELGEDVAFREKEALQKLVDSANGSVESLIEKKIEELNT